MTDVVEPVDDAAEDDPKEVTGVAPTLDEVHRLNQSKVEEEDFENEEDLSGADSDDTAEDDKDESVSDDGDAEDDSQEEPVEPVVDEPAGDTAPKTTESNSDITKPGEGKVAIKDAEGNTLYFNNLEEVPDDFEPASYKTLMAGTKALLQKEQDDAAATKVAESDAVTAAHKKATDDMQASWEADASKLVQSGVLPNEPKKLEAAKNEVYNYIESELKNGNIITSFNQAYKALQYDKQQAKAVEDQKEVDRAKKERGGVVQPGSGGNSSGSPAPRSKIIEAPPSGVGLDAVHARALSQL